MAAYYILFVTILWLQNNMCVIHQGWAETSIENTCQYHKKMRYRQILLTKRNPIPCNFFSCPTLPKTDRGSDKIFLISQISVVITSVSEGQKPRISEFRLLDILKLQDGFLLMCLVCGHLFKVIRFKQMSSCVPDIHSLPFISHLFNPHAKHRRIGKGTCQKMRRGRLP